MSTEQTEQSNQNTNQENTQQKQKVEQIDATERINHFYRISEDFSNIKKSLNKPSHQYINKLFSLLGYNYKGKVEQPNILHLVSEAFLLGLFEELKKEDKSTDGKIKYNELLSQINWIIVQENSFIDNLKILTGIYNLYSPELDNNRIFKMFLVNIQATKNEILKQNEKFMKDETLNKDKFDSILTEVFQTAFNYTLNEFNSSEEDKKSLAMHQIFQDIKSNQSHSSSSSDKYNYKSFESEYLIRKNIKEENSAETKNYLESFYNFAINNIDDLLQEIELFNKNSANLLFKLTSLVSIKNIKRLYKKYFQLFTSYLESGLRNARLEAVVNFYKSTQNYMKIKYNIAYENMGNNLQVLKKWVDNNKFASQVKDFSYEIYTNSKVFVTIPGVYLYNNVYTPLKNLTVNVSNTGVQLVLNTSGMVQTKAQNLVKAVLEKTTTLFTNVKHTLLGDEPLLKINNEKEGYVTFEINKKLFIVDPEKARHLVAHIIDTVRNLDLIEITKNTYSYTVTKVKNTRNYIYESYRRFLELANEEDDETNNSNSNSTFKKEN
jgi:hypothetical protein